MSQYSGSLSSGPQRTGGHWGTRVLLAAVLVSLVVGGVAGGVIGGGVTYVVMGLRQPEPTPTPQTSVLPSPAPSPVLAPSQGAGEQPVAEVVKRVGPAVVTVVNKLEVPSSPWQYWGEEPQARGSGVIIDPDGYIVTNYHVIESAAELTVILQDGTSKPAEVVGSDYPFNDLAVIKVEGSGYPYATLGDSDALLVGQPVIAIGSALGDFRNTVTTGVVSGLGRSLNVSADVVMEGMIQTDAAINHGNSGGPLVNLSGEVIGINTAIIRGASLSGDVAEGLGFSIPSNTVRYVADQLIARGKVIRPYLGVQTAAVTRNIAAYYDLPVDHGVYVTRVYPDTPAERAGIRTDDIIVRIDEDVIDEEHPLINVLSRYQTGQQVTVELYRGREVLKLQLTLGERP